MARLAKALVSGMFVVSVGAFAQQPVPAQQPVTPASEALAAYKRIMPNLIKAAEKMPAESYTFKPTPDIRSFARVVNHVTEAQFHTCTTLNGVAFDPKSVPSDTADKDTVLAGLKASFAECDKAYGALTPENYAEVITAGTAKRTRVGMAFGNVSHDNEQYAELSTYLRLKGLVPPTSEK